MPSYLVLARKYRPSTFTDVVGQDHVIRTLSNSILSGRVAHAFLFCGVRGVGKTTVARILAKALNCTGRSENDANPCDVCSSCREIAGGISVDVQEIDGASNTSVENIREINENIKYPPVSSAYKIIIIDEVHMISINAFNALLKTLEEPPPHAKFIFATTESHKVPATINSRCQRFNFRTISLRDIMGGMSRILEQEKIQATEEALALVAREAQGSFRDALSLLDQVIAFGSGVITAEDVVGILGIAGRESFGTLMTSILRHESAAALELLHDLFHQGYDPEQFVLDMIHYLRNLIVVRTVPRDRRVEGMIDAPESEVDELESLAGQTSAEELQNLFSMLLRSEGEVKRSGNPWVALEMTILRMCHAPDLLNLSEIVRRLDSDAVGIPTVPVQRPLRASSPSAVKPKRALPQAKAAPSPEPKDDEPPKGRAEPERSTAPRERFTITQMQPLPSGTPDEVWSELKERMRAEQIDPALSSIMDHGNLITFGPTEVEIGFTKDIYKDQFASKLQSRPEVKDFFEGIFGEARIKILTLSQETHLATPKPYVEPQDGQTDLDRALRNEALDHPITRAVQRLFDDSSIEEIRIIAPKP
jgi:DNA polymerase III subunit gamma/tau